MHAVADLPVVILTEHLDPPAIEWISRRTETVRCRFDAPDFDDHLARADAVVIRTYTRVDQAFLDRAPRLRVVGRAGVGLDNVDLKACAARDVAVFNTPDANTQAVVEYVTAMLTDRLRPRTPVNESVSSRRWGQLRDDALVPRQMNEMTLGILGLGRIGSRVAQVGRSIGFEVIFRDLEPRETEATSVSILDLFQRSDVVTVHIDGRPDNRRAISASLIDRMKPEVLFLNTSRGFVLDEPALASFLRRNPAATAVLDVHDSEPIPPDSPLLALPNALLYPHLASRTAAAQSAMSWVVRDVARALGVGDPGTSPGV